MAWYVLRRLLGAVVVVWIISIVTFVVFQVVPTLTGVSPAYLYVGKVSNEAQIAAVESRLGLDQPLVQQYATWVSGVVAGREYSDGVTTVQCAAPCLGYSFRLNQPVTELIVDRFPVTLSLALGAAVLWLLVGIGLGVLSALRRGTLLDRAAVAVSLVGVSMPVFFTGMLLLAAFSYGPSWLRWFPDVHWVPFTESPYLWFANLVLPWIALAFLYAAVYARVTRSTMLDTLGEDYVRTARAKGLRRRRIVGKHAMRPVLTPLVTLLGLDLGALLGGAILTEVTFSLPGLGLLSYDAIAARDLPVIMGVTVVAAVFIVLANLVVDVSYGFLDPRVRMTR
ncbi:MAG: ABC transporter permease [Actinomycetota bacterium]|nr:MAG: ABC transporter permease [Actinomycetota bacterium]